MKTINKFDRDEIYNHYIQNYSDELDNNEINEYIDKIELIHEHTDNDIEFLKNQDIMEIDDIYMNFMFGEEFMKSNDKGRLKEY
tara:strand:+ start:267 stop:518 length:252 start_codon:yes stop_codon:yes gene_type:complete